MLINHNLQNSFLKDYLYLMEFLAIALRLPFGSVGPSAPWALRLRSGTTESKVSGSGYDRP